MPQQAGNHNPNVPMPQALQNYLSQLGQQLQSYGSAVKDLPSSNPARKDLLDNYNTIQENIGTLQTRMARANFNNDTMMLEINRDADAVAKQVQGFAEAVFAAVPAGTPLGALVPQPIGSLPSGSALWWWISGALLLGGVSYWALTRKGHGTHVGNVIEL